MFELVGNDIRVFALASHMIAPVVFSGSAQASTAAFVPNSGLQHPPAVSSWVRASRAPVVARAHEGVDIKPTLAALPAAFAAAPAFASSDALSNLPMATSLEVQFGAYLAVLLGTFLPVLFLIILYLNSEARRIGDFSEDE